MRGKYKDYLRGAVAGLLILLLGGGGYKTYTIYQNYWMLWGWANGTQQWVNETDAKVKAIDKAFIDLHTDVRKAFGNANIKSMLLQQSRLDKVEARLDKLDSLAQTEPEKTKPEGEGE